MGRWWEKVEKYSKRTIQLYRVALPAYAMYLRCGNQRGRCDAAGHAVSASGNETPYRQAYRALGIEPSSLIRPSPFLMRLGSLDQPPFPCPSSLILRRWSRDGYKIPPRPLASCKMAGCFPTLEIVRPSAVVSCLRWIRQK